MSFRDCRNFIEHLRALGYPKSVSLENFRHPNFPLVADLLKWLVERFDPDSHLDGGSNNMDERILLIRSATQFMMTKASIKLNPKKLYGSDGYAVRELLKITTVLYDALNVASVENDDDIEDPSFQFDISSKVDDLKRARLLATEITTNGAELYDLLGKEVDFRESREQAISKPLDIAAMEATIEKACAKYEKELAQLQEQAENIQASEASLDNKIEKKRAELERSEKRLQAMQKIKPAYQAEFRNLEAELEKLYDEYILKMRCIEALKQQLSSLEAAEAEIAEERRSAALKLIQKYEAEDVLVNISDTDEFDYEDSPRKELKEIEKRPATRPKTRLRVRTAVGGDQPKIFGSMAGDKDDDFSMDDSIIGDEELLKDNLDDEDFKALNMDASDDLGSLGSSDESELNLDTRNVLGNHGNNVRNLSRAGSNRMRGGLLRGQGPVGSNHSISRRAPSTKPMQDILSDDDF